MIFSSWLLYAEVSAWYIELNTMKLSAEKITFFLYCTVTQQSSKFLLLKKNTTWKQAIRFFFECGTRAFSLRNLVSGYECGRVFPAGVGPGSPSRDATNWLLSRFSLSVETRRQYGWLRMVFSGVRLFRAPIWWVAFGGVAARERQGALPRRAW